MRTRRKTVTFTCERCGADAGESGVHCDECHKAICTDLLASKAWCVNAATRSGDLPGETMLDTIRRGRRTSLIPNSCDSSRTINEENGPID